jgi:hypothetical protein
MGTFKNKTYEGKEIIVDEEDKDTKSMTFLGNGITIMFDPDLWDAIKKELIEALT